MDYRSKRVLFWSIFAAFNCCGVFAYWSEEQYVAVGHAVLCAVSAMVAVRWVLE